LKCQHGRARKLAPARAVYGNDLAMRSVNHDSNPQVQNRDKPRSRALLLILGGAALLCGAALLLGAMAIALTVPGALRLLRATSTAHVVPGSSTSDTSPEPAYTVAPGAASAIGPVEGSLTDELLKSAVWETIQSFYRNVRGCNDVTSTEIEVMEEPDSSGGWEEAWTVSACGISQVLQIKFTASPEGGIYYDITE
jgi:hypothetical protein